LHANAAASAQESGRSKVLASGMSTATERTKEVQMPARKKQVRKHEVRAALSNFTLAKAKSALTLQIYANGEKVGELQIGRGSLYWWGRKKQIQTHVSWGRFTKMMDDLAYGS